MDYIKDSFQKVKKDMDFLKNELDTLRNILYETVDKMSYLDHQIKEIFLKINNIPNNFPTINPENTTIPVDFPTHNLPFKPLKPQKPPFSTGNEGVPTDRQTNQQTDRQTHIFFNEALEVLNSLDNVKKEIRRQFKKITEQEFLVFSIIYQLSEEKGYTDYKSVSDRLNLTESSIRDYVGRLIKKGIPVEKRKFNNKIIQLSISDKLKKVASLSTILQLREI